MVTIAVFAAAAALLAPSRALAQMSGVPVTAAPDDQARQTSVTREPLVNAQMGLRIVRLADPGDSLHWWDRRQAGWERWMKARSKYPRATSGTAELYLDSLAEGFNRTAGVLPHTRFHFYVADTLNASVWPVGGGFFVVHAGMFRLTRDDRQFAFLIALEMAHEVLGHNMMPVRAGDVKWEPGRWRDGDFDGWPVEHWAMLVGADPIIRGGFSYSLQQESDALELVYRFFKSNAWEYDGISRLVADLLPRLNDVPGSSSLEKLHENLAAAVRLPHERAEPVVSPVDSIVNRETYQRILAEIERSPLQHYPWLLELSPYRDFVVERNLNIDEIRERYNPHADLVSKKIVTAVNKSRQVSLDTELDQLDERNDDLDARDKLFPARMARIYLRGLILLAHHRWADAAVSSEDGLRLNSSAEPFLWQRAIARQEQGQFAKFESEQFVSWAYFDHRRRLMIVQNLFLQGRYTDAAKSAIEYRRHFPFDIDGAFWETLAEVRLRRPLEKELAEFELFWGDRPIVRALKIFYYGYKGQFSEAQAAIEVPPGSKYLAYEWGILEFAQAWLRTTFDLAHSDDERSEKLMQLAELQWPISRLLKYNLPRDAVQNR